MRLWFFNFDGTISEKATDRTAARLDSACDALLRNISEKSSDQVVIISNRSIDDISERINVPGVILGGCNGMEWQLPSGCRIGAFRDHEDNLIRMRTETVSELYEMISGQGFEIEDKLWSIAVHSGDADCGMWRKIRKKVSLWAIKHDLTFYCGPDEIDVQMIRGFNRSVGINCLVRQFNIDPNTDSVVYAGHDESDSAALWWTMFFGGTAIVVGKKISVPGAFHAKGCSHLVAMIGALALVS
ncbi:MAG: trehalose-phosphatase [Pelobacteraceae bacterium]